jgi:hypothetical protein
MDIEINEPEFAQHPLTFRTAGVIASAKLLQDGAALKGRRGVFTPLGADGAPVEIKLAYRFLDAIPDLKIGGRTVRLARPLTWYEYVWIGLPMALVIVGGVLGAVIGVSATMASGRILRMHEDAAFRYALTGTITVGAVVTYFVLAVAIRAAIGR